MGMKQGTIIDATLIAATSSTKNEKKERDPEMHQTSKDKQWYCGMKVHIGMDRDSGLIYSVETTAAHVHDLTPAADLLHGEETAVDADAGYRGNTVGCQTRRREDWMIWSKQPKPTSTPRWSSHFG